MICYMYLFTCWYAPAATVGQAAVLQSPNALDDPGHDSPPLAGGGLSQTRDREYVPLPHVFVHVPHEVHAPHAPSTIEIIIKLLLSLENIVTYMYIAGKLHNTVHEYYLLIQTCVLQFW